MGNPSINVTVYRRLEEWRSLQQQRVGVDIRFTDSSLITLTIGGLGASLERRLDAMAIYVTEAKERQPNLTAVCLDYSPEENVPPTMYVMSKLPEPLRW
ncbi:hypothetical protein [Azospirillum argentinense]|uniref:Uncharacterized protein n=1 Tax=Azospirillum brasilense TaxID=192 RepID=A0A4D8QF14_AZOBR|nr:hypothetical protein [Azospirillum argentinense]QCO07496.1 hypothetical protein D3867_37055 [Azospirillum argentinense]